jgi:hypothetical protein
MYITGNEVVFAMPQEKAKHGDQMRNVHMRLANSSRDARVQGLEPLGSYSNYFIGRTEKQWFAGIPHYGRVRCDDVYSGIDLVWNPWVGLVIEECSCRRDQACGAPAKGESCRLTMWVVDSEFSYQVIAKASVSKQLSALDLWMTRRCQQCRYTRGRRTVMSETVMRASRGSSRARFFLNVHVCPAGRRLGRNPLLAPLTYAAWT